VARASYAHTGVTVTLELTEAETQYLLEALRCSCPAHLEDDTVWDALQDVMRNALIPEDRTARA
jgi:hypothetical protein